MQSQASASHVDGNSPRTHDEALVGCSALLGDGCSFFGRAVPHDIGYLQAGEMTFVVVSNCRRPGEPSSSSILFDKKAKRIV